MNAAGLFSVAGRTAVVTGASSGLGDRFARVLAGNGANVVAVARRAERLTALATEVPNVVPHVADLTDAAARTGIIEATIERFGRIDVLVNNAGAGTYVAPLELSLDDFVADIDLNLVALFDLSRQAARYMIEAGSGSIINIASILGMVGAAPIQATGYAAAKGGVVNLTRDLGTHWARKGVRVNAISPGWFPSEMTTGMQDGPSLEYVNRNTPMGRFGRVEELDGALLFLASDASSFVTGAIIPVDGGWVAR